MWVVKTKHHTNMKLYYYRPCAYNNGATLKCAGHGAEDESHRSFYIPHFDSEDGLKHTHLLAGVVVVAGYQGDQITPEVAKANAA